jgi:hypothetical protein
MYVHMGIMTALARRRLREAPDENDVHDQDVGAATRGARARGRERQKTENENLI